MFGGSSNFKGINRDDDFIKVAETVVLQFGECSKYRTTVMWNCTLIAILAVVSKQPLSPQKIGTWLLRLKLSRLHPLGSREWLIYFPTPLHILFTSTIHGVKNVIISHKASSFQEEIECICRNCKCPD